MVAGYHNWHRLSFLAYILYCWRLARATHNTYGVALLGEKAILVDWEMGKPAKLDKALADLAWDK